MCHRNKKPACVVLYGDGKHKRQEWMVEKTHNCDAPAVRSWFTSGAIDEEIWYYKGRLHRINNRASIMRLELLHQKVGTIIALFTGSVIQHQLYTIKSDR